MRRQATLGLIVQYLGGRDMLLRVVHAGELSRGDRRRGRYLTIRHVLLGLPSPIRIGLLGHLEVLIGILESPRSPDLIDLLSILNYVVEVLNLVHRGFDVGRTVHIVQIHHVVDSSRVEHIWGCCCLPKPLLGLVVRVRRRLVKVDVRRRLLIPLLVVVDCLLVAGRPLAPPTCDLAIPSIRLQVLSLDVIVLRWLRS